MYNVQEWAQAISDDRDGRFVVLLVLDPATHKAEVCAHASSNTTGLTTKQAREIAVQTLMNV